jgi:hypothetical protein
MKVIFLDNDGVICLSNNWGSRIKKRKKDKISLVMNDPDVEAKYRFDYFDKKAVKVLNQVLEETGAEIVVSSDWRLYANLEELGDYYLSEGIIKKPIGVTKRYFDCDNPDEYEWNLNTKYEQQRCIEVRQYLTDHPEITHWVCIDDLTLGLESNGLEQKWGLTNFVRTPRENEGIKESGIKEKLLKYLND